MKKALVVICLFIGLCCCRKTTTVEFKSPSGLQVIPALTDSRIITLTNFGQGYYRGGIIPENGVEVVISRWDKHESLGQMIVSDVAHEIFVQSFIQVNGQKGTAIEIAENSPLSHLVRKIIYVEQPSAIYKIFLTYREGDPHAKDYETDFDQLLATVKFPN